MRPQQSLFEYTIPEPLKNKMEEICNISKLALIQPFAFQLQSNANALLCFGFVTLTVRSTMSFGVIKILG